MRLFSILVSALILTVAAFPQYHQKALERAREIKLLQDDREAARVYSGKFAALNLSVFSFPYSSTFLSFPIFWKL